VHAEILPHDEPSIDDVVDVLSEAFFDYPVLRFVLGREEADYPSRLRALVEFFVRARVFRGEPLLGVRQGERLAAAAIVSKPGGRPAPAEFHHYRERLWSRLGPEAGARYLAFGQAVEPLLPDRPHLHLNMIGVRVTAQGRGLGRLLLDQVHRLAAADADAQGVSLNTEIEANVALYQHVGYRLLGQATVTPGLTTWVFWRPDNQAASRRPSPELRPV
jgi:ribosomal protein S18 acetylase RimI-like enzyme